MKLPSTLPRQRLLRGNLSLTLATVATLLISHSTYAASATWSGATDGTWATGTNWGGAAPGSTSVTTNTDTATFNDSGNGNTSITIDSGRNIQFITFDTAAAAAYTIGSAGVNAGNALTFTAGGKISLTATVTTTQTFNAPLTLAGNLSLENLNTTTGALVVAGNLTNTAASTITLLGATGSTAVNRISGNIVQGTGTLAVTVNSAATNVWELAGANNYNGTTTVNFASSGSLTFSGTNAGTGGLTLSKGLAVLNNATNGGIGSGTITFANGSLTTGAAIVAPVSLSNAISFGANTTVSGANSIIFNGDLTVGVFSRTLTNSITGTGNSLTLAGNVYLSNVATGVSGYTLGFSGAGTTNITGVIQDSSVAVNSGGANLSVGTGTTILSGANTYSGKTTINSGTLSVGSLNSVVGGTASSNLGAPVTVANGTISIGSTTSGGTLIYTGSGETTDRVVNLAGTTGGATLEQSGTGLLKFTGDLTAVGAGSKTLTLQGSTAGTAEISGLIVDNSVTNLTRLTKTGSGTWTLSGANTYTGATTINGGVLVATSLANGGVASSIGQSSNAAANLVINGGTLKYTGAITSTDRVLTIGTTAGSAIDASGTGALTLSASTITLSGSNTARSLSLAGSNTADNTFSALLANNGTGKTSLTKDGAGTWVLGGANTYTGNTTVNAGTLALGAADRIANGSALVMNGGTFDTRGFSETLGTLTLSASSTIDLGSGASALVFADSSAASWGSSIGLSFVNFNAGTDSIRIGTTSGGLTGTQLSQITINGLAASIDASGFLSASAVPEPSSFAFFAGAGALVLTGLRRKPRRTTAA